ncbi:MAG: prolipoprotein diacylglyceryl transferase [Clostridia bacterium]|nr:prolipoprotein diacylglyceryl transferase [Clostridia bacterium]
MFISMLLRKKQFPQVPIWKMVLVTVWLLITGVAGTMVLAYIEMGTFGGTSFYGAVFLVPLLITPAMLLKIKYKDILNLCAPAECAMLIVMRFDCLDKGCCFGRYLPTLEFQFPSQIVEMAAGAIVMAVLILMHIKNRQTHLYPWYMVLYGFLRFLMQGFRYGGTNPWVLGLSQGHFWSLISMAIGVIWIVAAKQLGKDKRENKPCETDCN